MKLYQVMFAVNDSIKSTLSSAGLIDGLQATPEELKNNKSIMFWNITVPSELASLKPIFIVYNIRSIDNDEYLDGDPFSHTVIVNLTIYTNKDKVNDLIENINNACELNEWEFDLAGNVDYDPQLKLYIYPFQMEKVFSDAN